MATEDDRDRRVQLVLQIASERLKLNPRDADALFALASAQATLDDAKGGIQTLDRLAGLDPDYPGLWVLKTKLHARLGEADKARQSRSRAEAARTPSKKEGASVPCPICEAPLTADATACPNCGVKFEATRSLEDQLEELSQVAIQEMVEEELDVKSRPGQSPTSRRERTEPKSAIPPAKEATSGAGSERGLTNGLTPERLGRAAGKTNGRKGRTNGLRGRTNGLTNGLRGRTNGLTNGLGRTNGLTNGVSQRDGLVNGLGRTNGLTNGLGRTNGLTNGLGRTNGLTNGLGYGSRSFAIQAARRRGAALTAGWKLYLIPLVCAALLLFPLFLGPGYFAPANPIQIDGRFGDWASVSKMNAPVPTIALNPDIDITRAAVKDNIEFLSFYVEVKGNLLAGGPAPGRITDAFYAFVDVDRTRSTGYQVQGIGADRMLRVYTWGGAVVDASLLAFNSSRKPTDWNGWMPIGPVIAAGSGSELEFETPWTDLAPKPGPVDVAFASRSWDGQSDAADVVATNADPYLTVSQNTTAPAVATGTATTIAQFTFHAVDGPITVNAINVTFQGTFGASSVLAVDLVDGSGNVVSERPLTSVVRFGVSPVVLARNQTQVFGVRPKVGVPDGTTIGAFVRSPEDVSVASGGIAFVAPLASPTSRAYVGAIPSGPKVDGAFGEWRNVTKSPVGNVQPVWDQDIDLTAYAFKGSGPDTYFTARVAGTVLNGTMIPALNGVYSPGPGPGGTVGPPPPPVNGSDYVRFYLDADGNRSTGYSVAGVGAEYMVEITGKGGAILTSEAMRFAGANPFDWKWISVGPAPAARGLSQIEGSVPGVPTTNASRAYFEMTGWNGAGDNSGNPFAPNPQDPMVISPGGTAKWSPGTSTWSTLPALPTPPVGPQSNGWSDIITTSANTTYAIATDSTVYRLASGGSSWTLFISPPSPQGQKAKSDVVAIATDSQNTFYAITQSSNQANQIYRLTVTTPPGTWGAPSSPMTTPIADMEYVGGSGSSATLYALKSAVNTSLMNSVDGGTTWTSFGTSLPASPGGQLADAGFTVESSSTIDVLLNNGTIERSIDTATTWSWIPKSGSSPSGNGWQDIAADSSGNLWVVGQIGSPSTYVVVWRFTTTTSTWTNMTGAISMTSAVAIATIPEFSDLVIPIASALIVACLGGVRRRKRPAR